MPEAGWVLPYRAHGRGFGIEAVAAALAWLDRETRHRRTTCLIARENVASHRIAAKNGFAASGVVRLTDQEIPRCRVTFHRADQPIWSPKADFDCAAQLAFSGLEAV